MSMFEGLDEQIKHDEQQDTTKTQRTLKWVIVGVLSVLFFGGLYMGLRMLQ